LPKFALLIKSKKLIMKKILNLFAIAAVFVVSTAKAQVDFTPSATNACAPAVINFQNTSLSGVHFDWNMGDGTTYNDQFQVSHTYTVGGNFNVTLNAYDAAWGFVGDYNMTIYVDGPPLEISMPSEVCPGDEVGMSVWMPDMISWSWDMGDGTFYSGSDWVNHTYTAAGSYYPKATIVSQCGTYVVEDTIQVITNMPYFGYGSNMWVSADTICPNSSVNGNTYSGFYAYEWNSGDGFLGYSYDENWTYTNVGNYTVTLTVWNGCGVDTIMTRPIVVSNTSSVQNPQVDVIDTVCPGQQFYAGSWATDGVSFVWDMDDGSPLINDQGHDYTYTAAGTYYPQVTITNSCGQDTIIIDSVVVNANAPVIGGYFGISQTTACPGDLINFWSNWQYNYYIDFGDGSGTSNDTYHSYTAAGVYPVSATIQNECGNSVTIHDTIYIQTNLPIINNIWANAWPSPACPGTAIELYTDYGYQSYVWDFGDGSSANGQEVDHIYNAAGSYIATVTVENGCGYTATASTSVQIQNNMPIDGVSYELLVDTVCIGDNIFIQGNDNEGITYEWDMGDGTVYNDWALTHSYDGLGLYYITITATNTCGNDSTVVDSVVVSDNYTPDPGNIQVFVEGEGCVGDEKIFVLIPSGLGSIEWFFGDGTSTTVVEQVFVQGVANVDVSYHTYTAPGVYWAKYELTNSCGNMVTDSVEITIGVPGDNVDMDVELLMNESQTSCQGHPVEFMALGGGTFIWDFGDGSGQLVTYNSLSPVYHTYQDAGSYTVTITGLNGCGNTDDSDETIVIPPSAIDVSTNTVVEPNCGDINGMAIVSASGGIPPYEYEWTNGDVGVIADSLQSGIFVVTVTDINGCFNEGIATVSDEEGVTILVDNIVDVDCYGDNNGSISISILGGAPPYEILWSNGDQTEDIFGLQAGPYEIFVTDANGCFAVESIEVLQPAKSNISVIAQAASCGFPDGSAIATVNNGTPPYNFIWPNATGPSNQTGGLAGGIHTLMVIDGNTCLLQRDFSINEAASPIIIVDSTNFGTCNGDLSDIYINPIGGVSPYTYSWSNSTSNQDLIDVLPGTYVVEVTGDNGCSSFKQFVVNEGQPTQPTICMVDVDTTTGSNLVVWEDINNPGIDSYNIYKESSQAGLYYLVGNQSADSLTQFFDYGSDPSIRSWRYKVSSVDDCGNESELSDLHKTIHLTTNKGVSGEINLIWDDYEGFSYPTFYINRYHPNTGWEVIDSLGSNLFSYTDATPPGDSSLIYMITIETAGLCLPTTKAQDYNSSRSNTDGINLPEEEVDTTSQGSGIEEMMAKELRIYPNPTNGVVQIIYNGEITQLMLFDVSGKLVFKENNLPEGPKKIDMSTYERGVYNIQLFTPEGMIVGKVIRE
jgi:PKD repeat protein